MSKNKTATPQKQRTLRGRMIRWSVFGCGGVTLLAIVLQGLGVLPSAEERQATETAQAVTLAALVTPSAEIPQIEITTVVPSATITEVPTYPPDSDAARNATAHRLMDGIFETVPGVISVGVASAQLIDENTWLVYAEVIVQSGMNTVEMAAALQQAAFTHLITASMDFSVIIDDRETATDYTWDNRDDEWHITPLSQ